MTNETEYGYRNRNDPNSGAISSLTAYSKDKEESMNRRTFVTHAGTFLAIPCEERFLGPKSLET